MELGLCTCISVAESLMLLLVFTFNIFYGMMLLILGLDRFGNCVHLSGNRALSKSALLGCHE